MASIKGIQLTSVKNFIGREGYGFSANIYFNGEKAGEVLDTADGSGAFKLCFANEKAEKDMAECSMKYFDENPKYFMYYKAKEDSESGRMEGIISDVIEELKFLDEVEKFYKKQLKQGYPVTVTVEYNERTKSFMDDDYNSDAVDMVGAKIWNEKVEKKLKEKYPEAKVFTAYESLDDFITK